MVITKLMGGMGNQMFQYAFAKKISLLSDRDLKMDLSFLKRRDMNPGFIYRDYDLNLFNIEESFINEIDGYIEINEPNSLFNYIKSNKFKYISKDTNIYLEGYWQCFKYFEEIEDVIKKEFTLKNDISERSKELLDEIKSRNSVMINIRRTDYLNTNFHGVMDVDYVLKAKSVIESRVDNTHYYIFSDDIEWCKENLIFENSTIVDHSYKGDRFSEYLELMRNCKHFIIPNSSFAWWAAYLSDNLDKIVIYPHKWFSNVQTSITLGLGWNGI